MLKHKNNVDLKDVYDTKKCVYHRNLLITRNTKKCVYLEDNRSWLEDARKEKRCWIISESDLDQISTRSLTSSNQFWHIRNRRSIKSMRTYDCWIARESIAHSVALIHLINKINENIWSLIARESQTLLSFKKLVNQLSQNNLCHQIWFNLIQIQINLVSLLQRQVNS